MLADITLHCTYDLLWQGKVWGALTRFRVGWAGSDPWTPRPSRRTTA